MGKIYNGSIITSAGFNYPTSQPLDDRAVVEQYSDLAELVGSHLAYEGIKVYVVNDKKSYILINGTWEAIATEDWALEELKELDKKVDKVDGKGLSTNDFTDDYKNKLTELENKPLPEDVVQDANYVHTDNNYTTEDKTKLDNMEDTIDTALAEFVNTSSEVYDMLQELSDMLGDDGDFAITLIEDLNRKADKTDVSNLEKYGTTDDVYILTEGDIWIEGTSFVAQKHPIIEHNIVVIPEGITDIVPYTPEWSDELQEYYWPDNMHPINIQANKIICPNTLYTLNGSNEAPHLSMLHNICVSGEVILNEGLQRIDLQNDNNTDGVSIGTLSLPSTIQWVDLWGSDDIIIPSSVDMIHINIMEPLCSNLYVHNPRMDFTNVVFNICEREEPHTGTIYGYVGSTAEQYAKENHINFVDIKTNKALQNIELNINLLEKYGTTDVYVLQEDVDFITDDTGTTIVGAVNGKVLNFSGKTIIIPEGIIEIYAPDVTIEADTLILPNSLTSLTECGLIINKKIILSEGENDSLITGIPLSCDIYLPSTLIYLNIGYSHTGNVYCNEKANKIIYTLGSGDNSTLYCPSNVEDIEIVSEAWPKVYIYNTSAKVELDGFMDVYGYAGSTTEKAVDLMNEYYIENGGIGVACAFTNIGSDCTPFLNKSTSTEAIIGANKYYTFTDISSLAVTLEKASITKLDEFMFSFETPADISTFSFGVLTDESVEIKWVKEPNLKPDYIYEVSVVNGVGVIAGTPKEVA